MNSAFRYIDNPDSSFDDYKKSCFYGALHGANPGFGIAGSVGSGPVGRYVASGTYGYSIKCLSDRAFDSNPHAPDTCPLAFGED
jgi:hypothetical protein